MKNKKPKVILLVAGEGKRLRPYTLDKPKCMVEIDGVSLIDRQLAVLKSEGLDNIVMIGGYKSEMLKKYGIKLKNNPRYFETNMVWTLFCAED
jgi:choline kinase